MHVLNWLCEIKQAKEAVQYSILFGDGEVSCERDDTIFKYFYISSFIVECEERRETTGIQIKKLTQTCRNKAVWNISSRSTVRGIGTKIKFLLCRAVLQQN
jgi:hypothetical protein